MDKGGSNLKSQKNCLDNGGHYKETERIKIIVRERKKWGLLVLLNPAEYSQALDLRNLSIWNIFLHIYLMHPSYVVYF
jgi:hypothetical protein